MAEVRAYLVSAPRLKSALYEAHVAQALHDLIVRHGALAYAAALRVHVHHLPVAHAPAYVAAYGPRVRLHKPPHQGHVAALCALLEKLVGEGQFRFFAFRHHQQPRGVLVYPVHQAGAGVFHVLEHRQTAKVPCEGVHQCAVVVAHGGVDAHAGGFVDNEQRLVFIHDVKGDVLGHDLNLPRRIAHDDAYLVAWLHAVVGLHGLAVHEYVAGVGCRLDLGARRVRHVVHHVFVYPYQVLTAVCGEVEVLVCLPRGLGVALHLWVVLLQFVFCLFVLRHLACGSYSDSKLVATFSASVVSQRVSGVHVSTVLSLPARGDCL